MIYVDLATFLNNPKRYIEEAKNGYSVYICLDDGTELKMEKYIRNIKF